MVVKKIWLQQIKTVVAWMQEAREQIVARANFSFAGDNEVVEMYGENPLVWSVDQLNEVTMISDAFQVIRDAVLAGDVDKLTALDFGLELIEYTTGTKCVMGCDIAMASRVKEMRNV
jgi:hypothetical protein